MNRSTNGNHDSLMETIPSVYRDEFDADRIAHVSFGAGPGGMCGEQAAFKPGLRLKDALEWIEHYRHVFRAACIVSAQGKHMSCSISARCNQLKARCDRRARLG